MNENKIDDIGRKFYIILKGSVYILTRKTGVEDGNDLDKFDL